MTNELQSLHKHAIRLYSLGDAGLLTFRMGVINDVFQYEKHLFKLGKTLLIKISGVVSLRTSNRAR